jgi:subtilase family serine protease
MGGAGGVVSVADTVKNQGAGGAQASVTAFYLSTNGTLDAADLPLGTRDVPALAPNASSPAATPLTIPPDTAVGSYFIIAKADAGNALVETLETNNVRAAGPIRIGPDLTVSSLVVPAVAGDGDTVTLTEITANSGGGAAAPSRTEWYLSANAGLDASDMLLGSREVGPLAAGASSSTTTPVVIPAGLPAGLYYILARADSAGSVLETIETNNIRVSAAIKLGADLVVGSLIASGPSGAGGSVSVTDVTKNQGAGTPTPPSTTAFYLSTNTALDAADTPLGTRPVRSLGAGQSETASTVLQIPAGTPTGTYFVLAKADGTNQVIESVETNNVNFAQLRIGPDLIEWALTVSGPVAAGGSFSITETVKNVGGGAAGPSTTRFYLSTNSAYDAADVFVCSRDVPTIAAFSSSTATTPCTIPAGTAPGTMFLVAVADGGGAVPETSDTNNTAAVGIRIN